MAPNQLNLLAPVVVSEEFACKGLFPDVDHCEQCHQLEVAPFLVASRPGAIFGCCCQAVAIFKSFNLLREPDFWPDPEQNDHRGRLKAWIKR